MRKTLFFSAVLFIFTYCSPSPSSPTVVKSSFKKVENTDSLNLAAEEEFAKQNGAITNWEETQTFTYQLQDKLNNKVVSFAGSVLDVVRVGDSFVLKVFGNYYQGDYVAEVTVNAEQFLPIEQFLLSVEKGEPEMCVLLRVNEIQSTSPKLSADTYESRGTNDTKAYVSYDDGKIVQFKGDFVAFKPFKIQPEEQ